MTQLNQMTIRDLDAIRDVLPLDSISDLAASADSISSAEPLTRFIATTESGSDVYRMSAKAPEFARDVLALRSAVYGRPADECRDAIDEYSEHYVAYTRGIPHYAGRSTRAAAGPIECQECYPWQIISRFRDRLCSNGRFVRNPEIAGGREHSTQFMAAAWNDLIACGIRVDIANATDKLLQYHNGFGYAWLQVPTFIHPAFGTVSHTLILTADPQNHGIIPKYFPPVSDPVRLSDLDIPYIANFDALEQAA